MVEAYATYIFAISAGMGLVVAGCAIKDWHQARNRSHAHSRRTGHFTSRMVANPKLDHKRALRTER